MIKETLDPSKAGLLVVDVQEKLFPLVEHPCEMLDHLQKLIKGCKIFELPTIISEQYPKGLGSTIGAVKELAGNEAVFHEKTTFACSKDNALKDAIHATKRKQWIVAGIEAHVCILQTVRSLMEEGLQVFVAIDAISSRAAYDCSVAISEMRDLGARISTSETLLFEMMGDSKKPQFRALSALIKS
jgi:nicotinamidase-related amidase